LRLIQKPDIHGKSFGTSEVQGREAGGWGEGSWNDRKDDPTKPGRRVSSTRIYGASKQCSRGVGTSHKKVLAQVCHCSPEGEGCSREMSRDRMDEKRIVKEIV